MSATTTAPVARRESTPLGSDPAVPTSAIGGPPPAGTRHTPRMPEPWLAAAHSKRSCDPARIDRSSSWNGCGRTGQLHSGHGSGRIDERGTRDDEECPAEVGMGGVARRRRDRVRVPNRARSRSVCVVIPALNEEEHLPEAVDALAAQTVSPNQVIVADGGSTDRTAEIARARECRVVRGGLPGMGRNNGAREAQGSWLLFLDADVVVPPAALEQALEVAEAGGLDGLSCWFVPDSSGWRVRLLHWVSAGYFWLSTRLRWPHSIGGFILVRRELHEAVGGFDESVMVAEDQDYARRISRLGRYAFVRRPRVVISTRRFRSDGFVRASARWLGIELHRILLGEVRRPLFRYFDEASGKQGDAGG
ncbi:MAG: glycosyltransferase [Gemmatimonadetes bacterium]|nr:glycosyltransferase [Gemmatimonadota bacterium]MYI65942.1 glycosyltransferase [Gemmatimonadota bacterium]